MNARSTVAPPREIRGVVDLRNLVIQCLGRAPARTWEFFVERGEQPRDRVVWAMPPKAKRGAQSPALAAHALIAKAQELGYDGPELTAARTPTGRHAVRVVGRASSRTTGGQHEAKAAARAAMGGPPMPGDLFRELVIKPRGLTLEQVAADTGLSLGWISQVVNGRKPITVQTAEAFARAYSEHNSCVWRDAQEAYDEWCEATATTESTP